MKKLMAVLFFLLPLNALAVEDFSTASKYWLATALVTMFIDYQQTLYTADHPEEYTELNELIGEHPSRGRVRTYFALYAAGTIGATYLMDDKYRPWFLAFVTGLEVQCILNNRAEGVGIRLRSNF